MRRIKPEQEIKYICTVIDKNIEAHKILKDRGVLSENILAQLRNLTENLAIFLNNMNKRESIKDVSLLKKKIKL